MVARSTGEKQKGEGWISYVQAAQRVERMYRCDESISARLNLARTFTHRLEGERSKLLGVLRLKISI